MSRAGQKCFAVGLGKKRYQLSYAAQVKTSVSEHLEEYRVLSSRPGDLNAQIGFVLFPIRSRRRTFKSASKMLGSRS